MFQRHLPRMRKIGINTTGLTPHRAIPMLTRIVKFCEEKDLLLSVRVSLDGKEMLCQPFNADLFTVTTGVKVNIGAANGGGAYRDTSYVYDNVTIEGE